MPLRARPAIRRAGGLGVAKHAVVARLMIAAALQREETRGVHVRTYFPATDDEHWQRHISFCRP